MIDLKKTYRTRNGREVRLYADDGAGSHPVHGAFFDPIDGWMSWTWTGDGRANANRIETESDLIEVVPERWHPIVEMGNAAETRFYLLDAMYPTREEAMSQPCAVDAWKEPGEQA